MTLSGPGWLALRHGVQHWNFAVQIRVYYACRLNYRRGFGPRFRQSSGVFFWRIGRIKSRPGASAK